MNDCTKKCNAAAIASSIIASSHRQKAIMNNAIEVKCMT